jgi:hypothetical protein
MPRWWLRRCRSAAQAGARQLACPGTARPGTDRLEGPLARRLQRPHSYRTMARVVAAARQETARPETMAGAGMVMTGIWRVR